MKTIFLEPNKSINTRSAIQPKTSEQLFDSLHNISIRLWKQTNIFSMSELKKIPEWYSFSTNFTTLKGCNLTTFEVHLKIKTLDHISSNSYIRKAKTQHDFYWRRYINHYSLERSTINATLCNTLSLLETTISWARLNK